MLTTIMAGPDGKSSSLRKLVVEGVDDSPNVQVGGTRYLLTGPHSIPLHRRFRNSRGPPHPCARSSFAHVLCRPTVCSQPCCTAPAVRLPNSIPGNHRPPPAPNAQVKFCLKYRTSWGQSVKIIGSHPMLGNWDVNKALQLQWTEGDRWVATLELPAGAVYEYK